MIASDGVWEFLKNEDIVNIVEPFYRKNDVDGAVEALIKEASNTWKNSNECMDDITCIILFLNFD